MERKKVLIFDSGALINLSMNGLLYILPELKKSFNGLFLITKAVKKEVVDRPITIHRFELGALRVQKLIEDKVLELPEKVGIDSKAIDGLTESLGNIANHYIQAQGRWIKIVSDGEMSCLALNDECEKLGFQTLIAIDERTTRLLAENPQALENLMTKKLHQRAKLIAKDFKIFEKYKFIRSSELVYVAYKKDILHLKGKKALEASLYATKFHGSSITFEEIEELKQLS